jgi:PadR family transcriptional regulator, regulatory protein PadR
MCWSDRRSVSELPPLAVDAPGAWHIHGTIRACLGSPSAALAHACPADHPVCRRPARQEAGRAKPVKMQRPAGRTILTGLARSAGLVPWSTADGMIRPLPPIHRTQLAATIIPEPERPSETEDRTHWPRSFRGCGTPAACHRRIGLILCKSITVAEVRVTVAVARVLREFLVDPSEPCYGYELMRLTGFPSGKLYPLLGRLHRAGWLTREREDVDSGQVGRPARFLYRLSHFGAEAARYELAMLSEQLEPTASRRPQLGRFCDEV